MNGAGCNKENILRKDRQREKTADWHYFQDIFRAEGFNCLGWLSWPLEGESEEERKRRERAFLSNTGPSMPPGLAWMKAHRDLKYRPDRLLKGAKGVLVTGLGYYREDEIDSNRAGRRGFGRVARYARGRDYHRVLGGKLRRITRKLAKSLPGHSFRTFTDTGPLDEVWLAEASGLGFRGRNGLAILQGFGSWILLGHVITTYAFGSGYRRAEKPAGCPPGCRRCIDACPNEALSEIGLLNASRCISYMTIEHRGALEYGEALGDRIVGCDACQEACPFNRGAAETETEDFKRDIAGASLNLAEVAEIASYGQMVGKFAGSVLMRVGLANLLRNAHAVKANFEREQAADLRAARRGGHYPEADSNG